MRDPEPTDKEREAWELFVKLAEEFPGNGKLSAIAAQELTRLAAKGNPLAARFKEKLSQGSYRPRTPDEAPSQPPEPRRIKNVHWMDSSNANQTNDRRNSGLKPRRNDDYRE
jgi:hypothetical protein